MMNRIYKSTRTLTHSLLPAALFALLSSESLAVGSPGIPEHHDDATLGSRVPQRADSPLRLATVVESAPQPGVSLRGTPQSQSQQVLQLIARKEYDAALKVIKEMTDAKPTDPLAYGLAGVVYVGKGDLVSARKSYETALALAPGNKEIVTSLAKLDMEEKNLPAAKKRFGQLLESDPNYVPALVGMGRLEALNNNEKDSLAWIEKAKKADPAATYPRVVLGGHLIRTKKYAEAIAELTDADRYNPSDPDVLDLLGQAQMADGRTIEAIATYKRLVAARPELPVAYTRLADAQMRIGDLGQAREALRHALELKSDYLEAMVALVDIDLRSGNDSEALQLARRYQSLAPTSPLGISMEGDVHMSKARYADAAKAYEKARAMGPSNIFAIKAHAAQSKAGNADAADAQLLQWINAHPKDIGAAQYFGDSLSRAGRTKQAIEQYERVIANDPNNALALNNLANLYLRENDKRAVDTAEKAYTAAPTNALVMDTLGWILIEKGDSARGLKLLRDAADKDPKNPEIAYHLGAGLARAGDRAGARRVLENLLSDRRTFPQREQAEQLLKRL